MKQKVTLADIIFALVNEGVMCAAEFPTDPTQRPSVMDIILDGYAKCATPEDQIRFWVDYLKEGQRLVEPTPEAISIFGAPEAFRQLLDNQDSIASWAIGVLLCKDAIIGSGLADFAIAQIKAVASQEVVYRAHPAVCAIFTALTDAFKTRIDRGVYARGESILNVPVVETA